MVIAEKQTLESVAKAAREVVASAPENGIVGLWRDHIAYWHEFWTKSGVVMHSDDGLADYIENLYHLQLYWMAACSRGPEAPKFNGGNFLFCKDWRSWGGYYWYQNTREMFWPLLAANHAELCAAVGGPLCSQPAGGAKAGEGSVRCPGGRRRRDHEPRRQRRQAE